MAEVMRLPRLFNKFLFFKQSKMTEDVRFAKNFLSQHLARLYRVFPKCGQTPSRTLPARRSGANSAKTISMSKRNEHHLAFSSFTSCPCSSPCTTGITKPVYVIKVLKTPHRTAMVSSVKTRKSPELALQCCRSAWLGWPDHLNNKQVSKKQNCASSLETQTHQSWSKWAFPLYLHYWSKPCQWLWGLLRVLPSTRFHRHHDPGSARRLLRKDSAEPCGS